MRRSVCWPVLVIAMGFAAVAVAQQPYGDSRLRNQASHGGWGGGEQNADSMMYRWRPRDGDLEQAARSRQSNAPVERRYGNTRAGDYTDEPFGLPRGTYRSIEERHTIVPHERGFRFRPLSPDEQQRVKARNEEDGRTYDDERYLQGHGKGGRGLRPAEKPRFRPDKRFDDGPGRASNRYAYPEGPQMPRFRPQ